MIKTCKACGNEFGNTKKNFLQKKSWRINKEGKKVTYLFLSLYCKSCEPKYSFRKPKPKKNVLMFRPNLMGSKTESYFEGDFGEQESLARLLAIKEINE